jgi:hypothetical protein
MKNFLLILLILFLGNLVAQKKYFKWEIRKHQAKVKESKIKKSVLLSQDTIFNKGIPFALLKEKKQIPHNELKLYALNNNCLVDIQSRTNNLDQAYYSLRFKGSGKTAEVDKFFGPKLEKVIVENDLIRNNTIDVFNETQFLIKFPPKFSNPNIKTYVDDPEKDKINSDNVYETKDRDRLAKFYFREGKIAQDYKIIGSYKVLDSLIRFYLPNGLQTAAAWQRENANGTWTVKSLKENKNLTLKVTSKDPLEDLIQFLLEKLYL